MTEPITTACLLFPDIFPKPVVAQSDRREGSSDGGAFLLRVVDRRYELTDEGLGEAEFAQDDYDPAQRAFRNAFRMNSNDQHRRERLQ